MGFCAYICTIMKTSLPSLKAEQALKKLGADIATARKRRRMTQQRLAEGAGASVATIRRLEKGDSGISLGVLSMVLLALGETSRLSDLLDLAADDIGLMMERAALPKRVRGPAKKTEINHTSSKTDNEAF